MSETRVREILRSCDALLDGHFRYTSGRHGSEYFEKIRIVQHPDMVMELGKMLAEEMSDISGDIGVVCAPAFGAIVFGLATALELDRPFAFLQRDGEGVMTVRSGFTDLVHGEKVLLVEDVTTTGGSIRESIEALAEHDAEVVMTGLLVDRTNGTLELPVPYRALLTVDARSWDPDSCPLCADGIPVTKPGSSGKKG
jgi:orotate phosphoribosyltransferase